MRRLLSVFIASGRFDEATIRSAWRRGAATKYIQQILSIVAICALLTATGYAARPFDQENTIPAGTVIPVSMIDTISSDYNQAGQTFRASVAAPVRVGNQVVLPKGANAYVRLVEVRSAGKIKGRNELQLALDRVVTPHGTYTVHSDVVVLRGHSQTKKTAKSAGIGAAIGGGLGAILGGGKGAAIGAGLGGGTGVATRAFKESRPISLGPESLVNFRLSAPIRVRK